MNSLAVQNYTYSLGEHIAISNIKIFLLQVLTIYFCQVMLKSSHQNEIENIHILKE